MKSIQVFLTAIILSGAPAYAQVSFDRLRDRGPGIPTSLFGTYVEPGQLIVYPFFEYYRDNNLEYEPFELGHIDRTEFRGRYRASEGLIFVGYGISERLAVEFEIAGISASLQKSPFDSSTLPARLEQSGLGDVEGSASLAVAEGNGNPTRAVQLFRDRDSIAGSELSHRHVRMGVQVWLRSHSRDALGHRHRSCGGGQQWRNSGTW